MKCKKVLISLMLSLAMVFTALPAMAFAAPQEKVETKGTALNDKTDTFDEILTQIDNLIGQVDTWVERAKNLDASTIRMGSYMAIESLKSYLESMLEEYTAKLAALLVEKADDIDEAIKMATAMYDEYKGAYDLLRQAYENRKPKIQNYLKLAKQTKGIKVKVVSSSKTTSII